MVDSSVGSDVSLLKENATNITFSPDKLPTVSADGQNFSSLLQYSIISVEALSNFLKSHNYHDTYYFQPERLEDLFYPTARSHYRKILNVCSTLSGKCHGKLVNMLEDLLQPNGEGKLFPITTHTKRSITEKLIKMRETKALFKEHDYVQLAVVHTKSHPSYQLNTYRLNSDKYANAFDLPPLVAIWDGPTIPKGNVEILGLRVGKYMTDAEIDEFYNTATANDGRYLLLPKFDVYFSDTTFSPPSKRTSLRNLSDLGTSCAGRLPYTVSSDQFWSKLSFVMHTGKADIPSNKGLETKEAIDLNYRHWGPLPPTVKLHIVAYKGWPLMFYTNNYSITIEKGTVLSFDMRCVCDWQKYIEIKDSLILNEKLKKWLQHRQNLKKSVPTWFLQHFTREPSNSEVPTDEMVRFWFPGGDR